MQTGETDEAAETLGTRENLMKRCFRLITVEPFVFLCIASAVFKFVILPQFLLETLCNSQYNMSVCMNITQPENAAKQIEIQTSTAKWMLALYSCSITISVFTVPILGCLADVFGKKRTLCIPLLFFTIQSIVYCVLGSRKVSVAPGYFFIPIVFGGLSGDVVALIMLNCSYLSAITTEKQRTLRLTFLDGVVNLSICIFTFSSGHLISAIGYTRVFFVSIGLDILSLICLLFFVPDDGKKNFKRKQKCCSKEAQDHQSNQDRSKSQNCQAESDEIDGCKMSLPADGQGKITLNQDEKENNEAQTAEDDEASKKPDGNLPREDKLSLILLLREANPIRRFHQLAILIKEQGDTAQMVVLLILFAFATMSVVGESLTLVLYIKNKPFNMDAINVGYLLSLQGLLRFLGGYIVLNIFFQRCCKWRDVTIICTAFSINLFYYVLLGVANTSQMLYGIQIIGIFGPLANPTLRSVVSKKGNSENYASILSLAQTIDALGSLAVNLIVNSTYFAMVRLYPGAFCFTLAVISAFGAIMSIFIRQHD